MSRSRRGYGHKRLKVLYFRLRSAGCFPHLIIEEWIMPAVWFGTIVLWEVKGGKDKVIKHKDTRNINVYVHDDIGSDEAKPRIVAEYIGDKEALWKAYGEGLLQVYDIDKTIVTPPHISSDNE
jgi:hypothetical protein